MSEDVINFPLESLHSGAWLRLQRLLKNHKGFSLIIAQYNDMIYRDKLIAFQQQQIAATCYQVSQKMSDFSSFENKLYQLGKQHAVLNVTGLDSCQAWQADFFQGLNYHREQIAEHCPATLIFWLSETALKTFAQQAADFWAWRAAVLDFSLLKTPELRKDLSKELDRGSASYAQRQARIKRISDYLKDQGGVQSHDASLLLERGRLYQNLGENAQALADLEQAQKLYQQVDNRRSEATCFVEIADIKVDQGDIETALKQLKKTLSVYDNLGDVRSKAVTMGKIADILQARGQLDDALKIRQTEQLPVYEKLGDVRSKAVTMGQIADILQARGQLDDALKIREHEELPVYEKLGDVRSKAVTERKIADILIARGELEQALVILQERCIPPMENIGAIADVAVFKGIIADILQARGQLDDALKIHEHEALPVYEKLGDVRSLLITRAQLAMLLWQMDARKNSQRVQELLCLALTDAQRLQIPEAEQIKTVLAQMGLSCD
ncbi:tetratricopeptide repeat protein [Candidatus Venteria ishoeyi]|uniref:Tetratricopeptide repeat protein n=1 Tax=Candidatus Venteria ishoeyi TaxID=1899563 RepID=A0A1H6FF20_9GAMM|nr:tetratricopeptide repeat protein [Candidatus Venteria ishoeyi]SEH07604.1 Tetratricopeptide repeat protein [Candidatus Venteria ishoeyi]